MSFTLLDISYALYPTTPITGSEIAKLVEDVIARRDDYSRQNRPEFMHTPNPDHPNRILVGQLSNLAKHHIIVTDPASTIDGLLPDLVYEKLIVRHHRWPGVAHEGPDADINKVLEIIDFMNRLALAIEVSRSNAVGQMAG